MVLVSEALEDPPCGVALLAWRRRIGILRQDLVDHRGVGAELGLVAGIPRPIAGRLGVFEDLLERPPAHLVVTADLALGDPLDEHLSPDLCPQLHVCVHPSPVLLAGPSEGASERASGPRPHLSGARSIASF